MTTQCRRFLGPSKPRPNARPNARPRPPVHVLDFRKDKFVSLAGTHPNWPRRAQSGCRSATTQQSANVGGGIAYSTVKWTRGRPQEHTRHRLLIIRSHWNRPNSHRGGFFSREALCPVSVGFSVLCQLRQPSRRDDQPRIRTRHSTLSTGQGRSAN